MISDLRLGLGTLARTALGIYGVTALDPGTFTAAAMMLAAVAAAAAWLPARRASRIDPAVVMRQD